MKKSRTKKFFFRIQNRMFQKLFFKNWLLVFFSIMLPLIFCAITIQYYSNKSILQEIDISVQRSMRNTKATLETLLEEARDTLGKESLDQDIQNFLNTERMNPAGYDFTEKVLNVLERLVRDKRDNLYFSLDMYAASINYLTSTLYRGQLLAWISDKSLIQTFETYRTENPNELLFAVPRITKYLGKESRVITVYQVLGENEIKDSFVSISINVNQLIDYITDNTVENQGAYLIIDENQKVILDTTGELNDMELILPESESIIGSATQEINGKKVMLSWSEMEFFDWSCVQIIPMEKYQHNSVLLRETIVLIVVLGTIFSLILSYVTSKRLFQPVIAILRTLENPSESENIRNQNSEIQYLLLRILEIFQKNITLEQKMLDRVWALRRARAKALQEQMTPHFINNVLQTINWIAIGETGEEESVTSKSIILLAEILETGKNQKACLTTVREEVEYTKKFVELEKLRYGEGIECHFEIAPEAELMEIPGISLQTLVENSISHGFRYRGGCGNIYVIIEVNEEGGLFISVHDDGEGIEQSIIDKIFNRLKEDDIYVGEHLGLINFFQRFLLIYGENCKFCIEKSVYGGACVKVWTPKFSEEWLFIK